MIVVADKVLTVYKYALGQTACEVGRTYTIETDFEGPFLRYLGVPVEETSEGWNFNLSKASMVVVVE